MPWYLRLTEIYSNQASITGCYYFFDSQCIWTELFSTYFQIYRGFTSTYRTGNPSNYWTNVAYVIVKKLLKWYLSFWFLSGSMAVQPMYIFSKFWTAIHPYPKAEVTCAYKNMYVLYSMGHHVRLSPKGSIMIQGPPLKFISHQFILYKIPVYRISKTWMVSIQFSTIWENLIGKTVQVTNSSRKPRNRIWNKMEVST